MSVPVTLSLPSDPSGDAFAEAMARAEHDKERVLVTRNGRAVAALVPIEDVTALEAMEDAEDSRLGAEAFARWTAAGRPMSASLADFAARWDINLTAVTE